MFITMAINYQRNLKKSTKLAAHDKKIARFSDKDLILLFIDLYQNIHLFNISQSTHVETVWNMVKSL